MNFGFYRAMMHKGIGMLILAAALLSGAVCSANAYDDNPDYQFLYYGAQGSNYLDLTSIAVNEYNPPKYEISAITVHVSGDNGNVSSNTATIRYNYNSQTAYSLNPWTKKWVRVENREDDLVHKRGVILINAVFHAAYGMDFFH